MISPHTPPGTPLVVVWVPENWNQLINLLKPAYRLDAALHTLGYGFNFALKVGQRFTLGRVIPADTLEEGFCLYLAEQPNALYSLKHFDIAVLPSCITECLDMIVISGDVVLPCDC